ncbi:hypothetical protein [Streptomyces sp. CO7]
MQRSTENRGITRHLLVAATAVAALTDGMPAAQAEDLDSDQVVLSVVQKVVDGNAAQAVGHTVLADAEKISQGHTAEELDDLLAVPANADVTTSDEVILPGLDAPTDGTVPNTTTRPALEAGRHSVTRHCLLGSVINDHHTVVDFTYNGSKIIAWSSRYDYFTRASSAVDTVGREYSSRSALPTSTAHSTMQYKVQLCTLWSWGATPPPTRLSRPG